MCYIVYMQTTHRGINEKAEPVVVLSFRLPERLVKRIDAYADAETRNRVNMVQVLLQEALEQRDQRRTAQPGEPPVPGTLEVMEQSTGRKFRK